MCSLRSSMTLDTPDVFHVNSYARHDSTKLVSNGDSVGVFPSGWKLAEIFAYSCPTANSSNRFVCPQAARRPGAIFQAGLRVCDRVTKISTAIRHSRKFVA